ncbi:hypothetical protein EC957_007950 [Mortierella hygrophila]|uniref:Uncharacterized protein n=1 Tax=Mortierella hygrophila TaxID=979708 RepID=A0A9P6EWI7_9FUNG|nr:hypothetical protein EC957_007950 [Mortierella hygrophila]
MFKNIFNTSDSLRNTFLGQDELRARSQQGLQAMKSGVESLRTVLANNPIDSQQQHHHRQQQGQQQDSIRTMSPEGEPDFNESGGPGQGRESNRSSTVSSTSTTGTFGTRDRSGSGSWSSFLPPSLTNKRQSGGGTMSTSTPGGSIGTGRATSVHRQGSIAESVTESIKSLGSGLGLGQLAGGLGLTGHMGGASGGGTGPYLSGRDGGQASRSRVWAWNGQDDSSSSGAVADSDVRGGMESDADSIRRSTATGVGGKFGRRAIARTESGLKTGVKTEEASKETAALLAKIRAQQDVALERAKRMPEVEQMAQRYQDSWTEIHNHTTRNSERADDADEILQRVLELCLRHATTSEQLVEEAKDIKQLDQSLGEIMSMTENIQQKLVGLESAIEMLEVDAEVLTLADWKKSQVNELDGYMESQRKELWNKAELLSMRSEQFQKEEAARKLRLYQNQFETDMAQFRRTQEERQQDLWKLAEAEIDPESVEVIKTLGATHQDLESASSKRDSASTQATTLAARTATTAAALRRLKLGDDEVSKAVLANPSSLLGYQDDYEDDELREKEDLDRFLGPATESDSKEDDGDDAEEEDESESEVGESPSDEEEEDTGEEEENEETSEDDDEDLDPIEKARRARAAVAAAAAGKNSKAATGSTISAFSALAKYSSTTSLIKP